MTRTKHTFKRPRSHLSGKISEGERGGGNRGIGEDIDTNEPFEPLSLFGTIGLGGKTSPGFGLNVVDPNIQMRQSKMPATSLAVATGKTR